MPETAGRGADATQAPPAPAQPTAITAATTYPRDLFTNVHFAANPLRQQARHSDLISAPGCQRKRTSPRLLPPHVYGNGFGRRRLAALCVMAERQQNIGL